MTPLDRMAARRIDVRAQWSARYAICRHVRGSGSGPRYRRGSNSWRPNTLATWMNPALKASPCPNCGVSGDDLLGADGAEYCSACGEDIALGDYDWTSLADCLRYRADLAAGLVESEEETNRCEDCGKPIGPIYLRFLESKGAIIDCDRRECLLRPPADGPRPPIPRGLSKALRAALLDVELDPPGNLRPGRTFDALVRHGWAQRLVPHSRIWPNRNAPAYFLTELGRSVALELARRAAEKEAAAWRRRGIPLHRLEDGLWHLADGGAFNDFALLRMVRRCARG